MIIYTNETLFDSLSETEKSIIDYINKNEEKIPYLSITNIAEKTFCSPATVSRTIQKCGFQGISELRFKVSQRKLEKAKDASPYQVNEILAKTYRECTQTIDNFHITSILQAIEYIKNAPKIYIYARGFTALVAEEFQMYLQLLGYDAIIVKDVMWMKHTDKIITHKDVVFILSIRSSTPELTDAARMAKAIGAKVIVCCCKTPTELESYADITIHGYSELIMNTKGQNVYSRVPLSIITRTIIEYLSLHHYRT